jgi:hypothetical protein
MGRVLLLSALFAAAAVRAAYVDELGLDETLRVNIGPPIAAAALGKDALVATSAGALALVNFRSGAVKWRFVLPEGALLNWCFGGLALFLPPPAQPPPPPCPPFRPTARNSSQPTLNCPTPPPPLPMITHGPPPPPIPSPHHFLAGQTLLSSSFTPNAALALSASASGALTVTAVAPASGALLWSSAAPARRPGAAPSAAASLHGSPSTRASAALRGGELFVWAGEGGGAARAPPPAGGAPGAALVAAAFDPDGALLALEAGGAGGGLALLRGAPATPTALRRWDVGDAAAAAAGRGALSAEGLALLPCGGGGAVVAVAEKEGGSGGVALLWLQSGSDAPPVAHTQTLRGEALLGGGGAAAGGGAGVSSVAAVPAYAATDGGAGGDGSGFHVLRVSFSSGAEAFVGVPCGFAAGAAAVVVARTPGGSARGGAGFARAPAGEAGGVLLLAAPAREGGLALSQWAVGGFPSGGAELPPALPAAQWGGEFGGGSVALVAPTLSPGGGLKVLLSSAGGGVGVCVFFFSLRPSHIVAWRQQLLTHPPPHPLPVPNNPSPLFRRVGAKGGVAWARGEDGACVVSAVALEVLGAASASSRGGGGGGGGALQFVSRLRSQAGALAGAASGVAAWARALAARGFGGRRAPTPGALAPELPSPHTRLAVTLSRTDGGGAPAACAPPAAAAAAGPGGALGGAPAARGWLTATAAESGALAWRLPLPLGAAMRGGGGGEGGAPAVDAPPRAHLTWLLTSRASPVPGVGGAEVLLVEAAPLGGSRAGAGYFVELTWVDGGSGAVTGRGSYTSPTPPSSPAALPLTLPASARAAYVLLHGEREGGARVAAVAPGGREWGSTASLVGPAATLAGVT